LGAPLQIELVYIDPILLLVELFKLIAALEVLISEIDFFFLWQGLPLLPCSKNSFQLPCPKKALNLNCGELLFPFLNVNHVLGIEFLNELEFTAKVLNPPLDSLFFIVELVLLVKEC
jgi:hypothetical protein